jgi:hypothetical protein
MEAAPKRSAASAGTAYSPNKSLLEKPLTMANKKIFEFLKCNIKTPIFV